MDLPAVRADVDPAEFTGDVFKYLVDEGHLAVVPMWTGWRSLTSNFPSSQGLRATRGSS